MAAALAIEADETAGDYRQREARDDIPPVRRQRHGVCQERRHVSLRVISRALRCSPGIDPPRPRCITGLNAMRRGTFRVADEPRLAVRLRRVYGCFGWGELPGQL